MKKHKKISSDFIQEKYMQLLEEAYISSGDKTKNIFLNNKFLVLSSLIVLTFGVFFYINSSESTSLFQSQLVETTRNNSQLIIKSEEGTYYKIPTKEKSWTSKSGLAITVNTEEIKINNTKNSQKEKSFTLYTPKNKTYNIVLPDLSKIKINKNSSIKINLFADSTKPNVTLLGEAFFNIAKQTSKTFKILANNMNIEVIGTEFNVSNYNKLKRTQLLLVEGTVKINHKKNNTFIHAGEQATIYNDNPKLLVENKDFSSDLAWLHEQIYFKNKPLVEIATIIENWYQVKFTFANKKLKKAKFTGTLEIKKGLTHFLQMLNYAEGVKYTINKKTITLN